jgi:hypothetical protein
MVAYKDFKKDPALVASNLFRVLGYISLGLFNPADVGVVLGTTADRRVDSDREHMVTGDSSKSNLTEALLDQGSAVSRFS